MAFICTGLPDVIRRNLTNSLIACFDGRQVLRVRKMNDDFEEEDSRGPRGPVNHEVGFSLDKVAERVLERPFQCLHFSLSLGRCSASASQIGTEIPAFQGHNC